MSLINKRNIWEGYEQLDVTRRCDNDDHKCERDDHKSDQNSS